MLYEPCANRGNAGLRLLSGTVKQPRVRIGLSDVQERKLNSRFGYWFGAVWKTWPRLSMMLRKFKRRSKSTGSGVPIKNGALIAMPTLLRIFRNCGLLNPTHLIMVSFPGTVCPIAF